MPPQVSPKCNLRCMTQPLAWSTCTMRSLWSQWLEFSTYPLKHLTMSPLKTNLVEDLQQIISQGLRWKEKIDMLRATILGTESATTTTTLTHTPNHKSTTRWRKPTTTTSSRLMRELKDSTSIAVNQSKRNKVKSAKTTEKKSMSVSLPNTTTLTPTPNLIFSPSPTTLKRNTPTTTITTRSSTP